MPAWKFEPASTTLHVYDVHGSVTIGVEKGLIFPFKFAAAVGDIYSGAEAAALNQISADQINRAKTAVKCRLIRSGIYPDIDIPISYFQAYQYNTGEIYIQITVPDFNFASEIADRKDGSVFLIKSTVCSGGVEISEEIAIGRITDISIYEGSKNQSIRIQAS